MAVLIPSILDVEHKHTLALDARVDGDTLSVELSFSPGHDQMWLDVQLNDERPYIGFDGLNPNQMVAAMTLVSLLTIKAKACGFWPAGTDVPEDDDTDAYHMVQLTRALDDLTTREG